LELVTLISSALAVFAYRKGLSLEDENALYNGNVFETLGYYDVWNDAARELQYHFQTRFGLDIRADLINWSRRGVFMYSVAHPRPHVLADISKRLFARAGLKVPEENFDYYAIDALARAEIYPVYPEIAERFGTRGSYLFKLSNSHLSRSVGDFLNLPQFLFASYKVYSTAGKTQMSHPRIERWLDNAALSDLLMRLARENRAAGLSRVLWACGG